MKNNSFTKNKDIYLIPYDLKCEYAQNPLGIDTCVPRFSWKLKQGGRGKGQSAYRIIVASSSRGLEKENGDLWDSGKVLSAQSVGIPYSGLRLKSGQECHWKVKVWDSEDVCSTFSDSAYFEMGLLEQNDWKAEWISGDCPYSYETFYQGPAIYLRKEFAINKKIKRARAYISGVGYYVMSINGKRTGDHVLDPGFTDYDFRVLYATYSIDDCINEGWNAVGVMVGNGWYCTPRWNGKPCLRLQIEILYEDGKSELVKSDLESGWQVADSPVRHNGIYDGEIYDANLEMPGWDMPGFFSEEGVNFKDAWTPAVQAAAPHGKMVSQCMEPIRRTQEIKPVSMHKPERTFAFDPNPLYGEKEKPEFNRYVFDFGQNIAGWVRLKVKGKKNTSVSLNYAETLYFDGNLNRENLFLAASEDIYILKGEGEEIFEPHFTYHGFRYVSVEDYPGLIDMDSVTAVVVHSDVRQVGDFQCSHPMINQLHKNILWTERGNLHSIPTDCPQRNERFGWVNDTTVRCEETVYNFDMSRFLPKWMNDIEDTQLASGAIADCAPYVWWGKRKGEPVNTSYVITPWLLYKHYGDIRVLTEHYEGLKKWVDFMDSKATDHILYHGWTGDWLPPRAFAHTNSLCSAVSKVTTFEYISTGYYYYGAMLMSHIAGVVGNRMDESKYRQLADEVRRAFNIKFFNIETKQYEMGSQAANSFALYLGLVPEEFIGEVVENLVRDVVETNNGHLTTGLLSTKYLMEALTEYGRHDIAWLLTTQTTYPSWGYMIENGATTVWERWEYETGRAMNSHNQAAFGSIGAWFYKALAGINVDPDGIGFDKIVIYPRPVENLDFVKCSLETVRGKIISEWEKGADTYRLKVTIPVNCTAKIRLQYSGWDESNIRITESDSIIWKSGEFKEGVSGLYNGYKTGNYYEFVIGSGSYDFCMTGN